MSSIAVQTAGVNLYWQGRPSPVERDEVAAWLETNDCSEVNVIGINTSVVAAFGSEETTHGWGATEMRQGHESLSGALTAVIERLRHMHVG